MNDELTTPWDQARSKRRKSQAQEKRIAALPGGRQQPNSGRIHAIARRDAQLGGYLVEARTTGKGSYSIQRDEFLRIERDAFGTPPGQLPAMQIDFEPENTALRTLSLFVTRLEDHTAQTALIGLLEQRVSELEEELRGAHAD